MSNPAPDFNLTNLNSACERCMRLLNKPNTDSDLRQYVQEMLGYSAGTKDGVTFYRPWYVAAALLAQDIKANNLIKAGDVQFLSKEGIIKALIATQRSLDISLGLTLPLGFSVESILGNNRKRVWGSSSASANFAF